MNRRDFLRGVGAVLGGLLLRKPVIAEETAIVADGCDDATEPLVDFLESFDCGVTWEYTQSCEGKDWCMQVTDLVPGPDPFLRACATQQLWPAIRWLPDPEWDQGDCDDFSILEEVCSKYDPSPIIGKGDCPVIPLEPDSGTVFYVADDGDDANDGLALGSSLQTVPEALSRCSVDGGDSVVVLYGIQKSGAGETG